MADVHSPETRSYNMSRIKNKNTKPEEMVRHFLFAEGFRYRKNVSTLPGCPDIVLPKYHTCIFVNGCFWHKHEGCRYFVWPKNNEEFWKEKITKNVERDARNEALLRQSGWKVMVVWECQLKPAFREKTLRNIKESLIDEL